VYVEAAVAGVEVSRSGAKKVTLTGRVVDATAPGVVYTEATALFIAKDIPQSHSLVSSLRDTYTAAATAAGAAPSSPITDATPSSPPPSPSAGATAAAPLS